MIDKYVQVFNTTAAVNPTMVNVGPRMRKPPEGYSLYFEHLVDNRPTFEKVLSDDGYLREINDGDAIHIYNMHRYLVVCHIIIALHISGISRLCRHVIIEHSQPFAIEAYNGKYKFDDLFIQ